MKRFNIWLAGGFSLCAALLRGQDIIVFTNGVVVFENSVTNRVYSIEHREHLSGSGAWSNLQSNIRSSSAEIAVPVALDRSSGFFRVVAEDLSSSALASVDFDGPEYVAGQLPPAPWFQEGGGENHSVEAETGYDNTQGLVVTDDEKWHGVTYVLPTALTSESGAVSISILLYAPTPPSSYNYGYFGGMQVGRGSQSSSSAVYRGLLFETYGGNRGIYGPGGYPGTSLGVSWIPNQWYVIVFEISEDWQSMTIGAAPVGGTIVSKVFDWDGGDITRIWVVPPDAGGVAVYDDLLVREGVGGA